MPSIGINEERFNSWGQKKTALWWSSFQYSLKMVLTSWYKHGINYMNDAITTF